MKSYDQKQADAKLVICVKCGASFFMTLPQPICKACRENTTRESA